MNINNWPRENSVLRASPLDLFCINEKIFMEFGYEVRLL